MLVQYFGMGEVTGNITVLPRASAQPGRCDMPVGSCGFPRTGMEVAILDLDGNHLPPGTTGEICVRGPGVFAGYHNNPEATAQATRFGWFHTGDLGHVDERGFVYITGRASDMYISGGSNVYPREIEEALLTHPVGGGGLRRRHAGRALGRERRRRAGARRRRLRRPTQSCWRISTAGWRNTNGRRVSCSGRNCRNPATARSPSAR